MTAKLNIFAAAPKLMGDWQKAMLQLTNEAAIYVMRNPDKLRHLT